MKLAPIKLKRGVVIAGVQPPIYFALCAATIAYMREACAPLIVTSLKDSHESRPKSLHNKGLAVDLRTKHVNAMKVAIIAQELHEQLDPLGFDVVMENDHIHIEYDPKQGEAFMQGGAP